MINEYNHIYMENHQFNENDFIEENITHDDELVNSILQENITNSPEINDSIQNHSLFQDNLDEPYLRFSNDLDIELIVNPLIFYHNYDNYVYYDMGKKVLAPKFLLHRLSKYNDIEYPKSHDEGNKLQKTPALEVNIRSAYRRDFEVLYKNV